jgi:hypothetical protein
VIRAASFAGVALLAACGSTPQIEERSDWERKNEARLEREGPDIVPRTPPYPQKANLVEFFVTAASDFKFYVDRTSIAVDRGIVRYVLVARSPSGTDNVSFEALRCRAREYRVYAHGRADGTWSARPGEWREIPVGRAVERWRRELHSNFFCPGGVPLADAAEGQKALELGEHPWLRSVNNPYLGGSD